MADYRAQISQDGVPLDRAADYQKTLDTKWPFLDIAFEQRVHVSKADWYSVNTDWYIVLLEHNLGYLPPFQVREIGTTYLKDSMLSEVVATSTKIILTGTFIVGDPTTPLEIDLFVRVFAVDMTKEYKYDGQFTQARPSVSIPKYGAKIINQRKPGARLDSTELSDFSLHTSAKALGIHKTGTQYINEYTTYPDATVNAIDTATDIFTMTSAVSWVSQLGAPCMYWPADYVTYPGPLTTATYFTIPMTPTTFKLASSYSNAVNGIAINITSTGALNGRLQAADDPSNPQNVITHDVGYPPTYFLAKVTYPEPYSGYMHFAPNEPVINMINKDAVFITADTTTLKIYGAQSVFSGLMAYLIVKDPAEVAS